MPALRAALALRARVLMRRHGTPLDALLVAATIGAGFLAGHELRGLTARVPLGVALDVALALFAALGAALAHGQLYRAKELVLLLAQPLSARALVGVRFIELTAWGAILGAILAAVAAGAQGAPSVAGVVVAVVAAGPLLAGAQLLLAWAARRAVVLALLLPAAVLALRPSSGPGASLARLVAGEVSFTLPLAALALSVLALALVPLGHGEAVDRLAVRPTRAPRIRLPLALIPLPRPAAALVRRDLLLIARGAFARGALVLIALPAGLLVFREASLDRTLEPWQGELAALMTLGALGTIAAFLFAIDFPRARSSKLVLERALPIAGKNVLRARWFEAALPSVLLALALALVASRGEPPVRERALEIALSGVLLALMVAHHGACFGLRTEAEGAAAELAVSAGYPIAAGTLVLVFALALTIHPALALAYPFTYGRLAGPATLVWERAEVTGALAGSA